MISVIKKLVKNVVKTAVIQCGTNSEVSCGDPEQGLLFCQRRRKMMFWRGCSTRIQQGVWW